MKLWLAAAASLVLGIAIGFASGYRAGQGATEAAAFRGNAPSESTSEPASGRTFSESPVGDPVRIEEPPVVPAPEPAGPAAGAPGSAPRAAGSAPTAPDRRATRPIETAPETRTPVGRVPPEPRSSGGGSASASPAAASGPGSIQVLSRPAGAEVTLDGRLIGKTPMLIPEVAAGSHSIRFELATFNPWTTTVEVKAGETVRVAASLEQ